MSKIFPEPTALGFLLLSYHITLLHITSLHFTEIFYICTILLSYKLELHQEISKKFFNVVICRFFGYRVIQIN